MKNTKRREENEESIAAAHQGYAITFNGEIYNHRELRARLETRGHSFRTRSDTEVLLIAYIEWGEGCVRELNGDFAFAIHDERQRRIFLARDRVGVKPLFYAISRQGTLLFASEVRSILKHPEMDSRLDIVGLAEYLLSSAILTNGCSSSRRSLFEGVRQFPPGHSGVFDERGLRLTRYWSLPFSERSTAPLDELAAQLSTEMRDAVRIRIPDETDFGTALSGGLDSSIVTAIAKEECGEADSFAVRFSRGSNADYESAAIVARAKELVLHDVLVTPENQIALIPDLVSALDEPHDTIRQIGLARVYQEMYRRGKKVALVGEGSDEFHLGYYRTYPGFGGGLDVPSSSDEFASILRSRGAIAAEMLAPGAVAAGTFEALADETVSEDYAACPTSDALDRMQFYYVNRFLPYRLLANDRLGMANAVEARVPFCDHRVIEVALKIPHALNLAGRSEKNVLRRAFQDLLPPDIVHRKKAPFPEDDHSVTHRLLVEQLRELIRTSPTPVWDIISKPFVERALRSYEASLHRALDGRGEGAVPELGRPLLLSASPVVDSKTIFLLITMLTWLRSF